MTLKRIFFILVCFFAASFVFSKILSYYIESKTPNVVIAIENIRYSDSKLKSVLGEPISFESKYNENDLQKDTLLFKVTFFGMKKGITINALVKKETEFKWRLIRVDTTYFNK